MEEEDGQGGVEGDVHNNVQPELEGSYLVEWWNPNDIFPMGMAYEVGPIDATGEDEEAVQNPESQPHERRSLSCKIMGPITVGFSDPLRSSRKTSSKYCFGRGVSYEGVVRYPADQRPQCLRKPTRRHAERTTLVYGLWWVVEQGFELEW